MQKIFLFDFQQDTELRGTRYIKPISTPASRIYLFVGGEVLMPSQPNGVISSAVSLPN